MGFNQEFCQDSNMSYALKLLRSGRPFLLLLPVITFAVDNATLPVRQGICGKSVNAVLKLNPKTKSASIEKAFITKEELCDEGRYEINANLRVILRNSEGLMVYDKQVFLNPHTLIETTRSATSTEFGDHKIKDDPTYRVVKFPLAESMGDFKSYEIQGYPDKAVFGQGTLPLVKMDAE